MLSDIYYYLQSMCLLQKQGIIQIKNLPAMRCGLGPKNNPDFVLLHFVTKLKLCNIKLRSLPYISDRRLNDVFLRLLNSDGPFQPVQTDPQQIALNHCRIPIGGIVSVPRARLSPPSFRKTVVGVSQEFPQLSTRGLSTVSCAFAPRPQRFLEK